MKINRKNDLEYITFDNLEQTGLVKHCFTTRHGGVSTDYWASMNMGFARGEEREPVLQNYKILAEAVGFTAENYVTSQQTHTTNVRRVTAAGCLDGAWLYGCGWADYQREAYSLGDFRGRLCACVPFG